MHAIHVLPPCGAYYIMAVGPTIALSFWFDIGLTKTRRPLRYVARRIVTLQWYTLTRSCPDVCGSPLLPDLTTTVTEEIQK